MSEVESLPKRRSPALVTVAVIAAGAAALAAIYVTLEVAGNGAFAPSASASVARIAKLDPLVKGEVAAVALAEAPQPRGETAFVDGDGKPVKIADWAGRTVLVNLWATWCPPCRFEMPGLDELQAKLGGESFEVVAINVDRGGPDKGKGFYKEIELENLAYYYDAEGSLMRSLKVFGLPTTILIDKDGNEIGRMAGPAEWASDDAVALMEAARTGE